MRTQFLAFCLALSLSSFSQDSVRTVPAVRLTAPVKIDGVIEDAWKGAAIVSDFTEFRPTFGKKEQAATATTGYIFYTDEAVYVAMVCRERSRDSISTELKGRDNPGVSDFAGVIFDTYHNKINGNGFFVTSLGEQFDARYSLGDEDDSWNTVYETATTIGENGWTLEMKIPYSALRFSGAKVQNWGIHFIRKRTKAGAQVSWNPIDPNKFGTMGQAGVWTGLSDIKPPLRLSFSPYFSTYFDNDATFDGKWHTRVNGGMDVKYGISQAFTLDMTLIPDFGQVQSDNRILNLSPFEVRFQENRTFFTEGTELFNKGNLFYSRRVGGVPLNYYGVYSQLQNGDSILRNPGETRLLNATKISGRTAKGLGIGFFNAVTRAQYATVVNKGNGTEREIQTSPLTNYNILVLDQTLKNNSSISLVNTNVLRNGSDYDANVTAFLFDLYDKNIDWNFWGRVANSRLIGLKPDGTISGLNYELNIGRFKGPFTWMFFHNSTDENYEQNDLGYFTNNNFRSWGGNAWYRITKPKGFYNNMRFGTGVNFSERYRPRSYQALNFYGNANAQFKNLWEAGVNVNVNPEQNDFWEPRVEGRVFKVPFSYRFGGWIATNSAKKLFLNINYNKRIAPEFNNDVNEISLYSQYRFSDKLSVSLSNYLSLSQNDLGFAGIRADSVIMGLRDRITVENVVSVKYSFTNKMGLTFRARHYWSEVQYNDYRLLKGDGYTTEYTGADFDAARNLNLFNIDMVYTWQFAPGSFFNITWKDFTENFTGPIQKGYGDNFMRSLRTPQVNNLSLKVILFIDYLMLKKKKIPVD